MIRWLFNTIYLLLLTLGLPWLLYRIVFLNKNRRGWPQRALGNVPSQQHSGKSIWFHAVSVGEIQLLGPLVDQFRKQNPDVAIFISTTTESGFDVALKRFAEHQVFFCPFDFSWAVTRAFRRIQPSALVLVELELWPNMLLAAEQMHVPVMVVNGRLSDRSLQRYQMFLPLIRSMLKRVRLIAAQSSEYAERFRRLGANVQSVFNSGNIKFDGAFNPGHEEVGKKLKSVFRIAEEDFCFVAGSTQPEEDTMSIAAYQALQSEYPQLKLVVVPRHMSNLDSLFQKLDKAGLRYVKRSQVKSREVETLPNAIVVDVMGELGAWWSLANFAYVGGSQGNRGGQNMIEPAATAIPVSFGPRTENFRDVVNMLLQNKAASVVHDSSELTQLLQLALENDAETIAMGKRAYQVVFTQQGATMRTCNEISRLIGSIPVSAARTAA
ncbi:MAG: 3-deoxy-D-manno-octulosonic acid transferase [Pirellulaceae bacterium]